ncbi:MAG: hypothetical protein OEV06_08120 [Anaerolineae bacterium]|nr:hypothetical protein [Anaerolineae bacterium]
MPEAEPKILCQTPTPGKQPTSISKWKYDLVRAAILDILPADDEGIEFKILPNLVRDQLSPDQRAALGSISWHTTTVKLDMEVKGDIARVPGSSPQRLRRLI